jgi:hypothetical protein
LNEWSLRAISLCASVALVAVVYIDVRHWTTGRLGAAAAALVIALDGNFIFYAVEARPYALAQLLATAHLFLFLARLQRGTQWRMRIAFIAIGALLVYLHYTLALLLVAEVFVVALLVAFNRLDRRQAQFIGCDALIVALCCLGALPHVKGVFDRRANWTLIVAEADWRTWFQIWHGGWYLALAFMLFLIARVVPGPSKSAFARAIALAGLWFTVFVICWMSTVLAFAPLLLERYLVGVSVVPVVLMGAAVQRAADKERRLGIAVFALAIVMTIYLTGYFEWLTGQRARFMAPAFTRNEDWRSVKSMLGRSPARPILLRAGLIESDQLTSDSEGLFYDYCRFPLLTMSPSSIERDGVFPLRLSRPRLVAAGLERSLQSTDSAWLILRRSQPHARRVAHEIMRERELADFEIESWTPFGRLQVIALRRRKVRGTFLDTVPRAESPHIASPRQRRGEAERYAPKG